MSKPRAGPYFNRSFSNSGMNSSMFVHPNQSVEHEGSSFSSLFKINREGSNNQPIISKPQVESIFEPDFSLNSSADDGGVCLQISNLDAWYDEVNLKNYLISQLKPITPVLSLTIETPSIAKVKVPSIQVRKRG